MKKNLFYAALILLTVLLIAAEFFNKTAEKSLFAFDTVVEISVRGRECKKALEECENEIKRLDDELGVNGSGILRQYNENGASDRELDFLIERALSVSRETDGAFDVTMYPVTVLWGFTKNEKHVPDDGKIREALSACGYEKLLTGGAKVDFGAAAKGYAADRLVKILEKYHVKDALISIGGTVTVWSRVADVAVRSPDGEGYAAVIECENTVLSTSGGYERYFEEDGKSYVHIIDPKSGRPAESGIVSATVVTEDGFLSDALSTAFFVMGEEDAKAYLKEHSDVQAILITGDKMVVSSGLKIKNTDEKYTIEVLD